MFRYSRLRMISRMIAVLSLVVGLSGQIPIRIPNIFANPFEKGDALTTSLTDAVTEVPFLDDFDPQDMAPLGLFPRAQNGDFVVKKPGAFEFLSRSYCLRAGTYGPGRGKGYLFAPLKGPSADAVRNVLQRSAVHPEIAQHDVQLLLWAIIAKTKPSRMNGELGNTTRILLTREEIARLEGSAFDEVSQEAFRRALGKLPPETQRVMDAERQMRNALTTGNLPFNEVERIAVLTGEPLSTKDDRSVPSGRWSFQPDGYFIRYFPSGYSTTLIEVYFPENFAIRHDAAGRIIAISSLDGKQLEIEYDETVAPLTVNREPGLTGSAFRAVRMKYTLPKSPRVRADLGTADMGELRNMGWTFSGGVAGRGSVAAASGRYTGAGGRYEAAKRSSDDLRKILDNISRLPNLTPVRPGSVATDELYALMHLATGLNDAFGGAGRTGQFFDPVEFVQRAWASQFARSVGVQTIGEIVPTETPLFRYASYSPFESLTTLPDGRGFGFGGGAASPGERGRQRLGVSDAPQDKDNDCKADFSSCQDSAGTSYAACNLSCLEGGTGLGQLNQVRKCLSACSNSYASANHQCSTASKKCMRK